LAQPLKIFSAHALTHTSCIIRDKQALFLFSILEKERPAAKGTGGATFLKNTVGGIIVGYFISKHLKIYSKYKLLLKMVCFSFQFSLRF